MTFYKVVSNINNKLISVMRVGGKYSVEYKLGKVVYPNDPNSKLFVFNSLECAAAYVYDHNGGEIYECEVEYPYKCTQSICVWHWVDSVYSYYWEKAKYIGFCEAPNGTYLCDSVKLIKKIT